MSKRPVHYVFSTHWDREWYQHFQDYRYRLVQLVDRVLDGWNKGTLKGPFQTDGQAILLEDYLEIHPERQAELEQRAKQGLFAIGPWYVMPDEFLVSGEALIRNLRMGIAYARNLGGIPSRAGYICDIFGHNSQMPQIFSGFNIPGAYVWRGNNLTNHRLFNWVGADGTKMLSYRFGWGGYCDYSRSVRASHQKNLPFDADYVRANLDPFIEAEANQTPAQAVLLFDGGDHMEWEPESYEILLERMARPDERFTFVHTTLDAYWEDIIKENPEVAVTLTGELREPNTAAGGIERQWLIPGVVSSRVWIKQQNALCQALLCQHAEPFSAYAHLALGKEYPQGFLNTAWKWLIQNHPHDSICGCSIDSVHEDMKYRFAQTRTIAARLTNESIRAVASQIEGNIEPGQLRVALFNPLAVPYEQQHDLTVDIPADWPTYNDMGAFEPRSAFRVYDAQGKELPYQLLGMHKNRKRFRTPPTGFPKGYQVHEVHICVPVKIPALGYTTLTIRAGQEDTATRHPSVPTLVTSERSMENEFLVVTVEANGSLTVLDKTTHQTYTRWLTFEDRADIGDGWNFGMAANDQAFTSTASSASVAVIHAGPQIGGLRIRTVLQIPAAFDFGSMKRQPDFENLIIDSKIILRAGSRTLEVEMTVQNTVRDHRLRVLFPTHAAHAKSYLADSPFDVVERPIALAAGNHTYRELELETKPQQTWTAVFDHQRGAAVISTGLFETAVQDNPERTLALTLFRATRRTVFTDGEPEGQLQGMLSFRFWLAPLSAEPNRAYFCRLGQQIEAGVTAAQLAAADQFHYGSGGQLPTEASLLQLEGDAVLTSCRMEGSRLELRLFNPNTHTVHIALKPAVDGLGMPFSSAQMVNFEGNVLGGLLPLKDHTLHLQVPPKKIVTIQFIR